MSTLSSFLFNISGIILSFLDPFGVDITQGDMYGFTYIFLHANICFDQHHFLKIWSFSPVHIFGLFIIIQLSIGVCIYIQGFTLTSIINVYVIVSISCYFYCSFVFHLEIGHGDNSRFFSLFFFIFLYSGLFSYSRFPYDTENCPSMIV